LVGARPRAPPAGAAAGARASHRAALPARGSTGPYRPRRRKRASAAPGTRARPRATSGAAGASRPRRRPRRGLPGNLVVWDAELFGDGAAVTTVPVEQLHNAGWLAELRRTPQRALVGDRVEHPDAPLRRD